MATGSELFAGEGEMAAQCRATDWAATSLGPVEEWPAALRLAVRTALEAPVPIAVWSGPELIAIYNDAYRELLGDRHSRALGRPYREVWEDIWDVAGPLFEQIRKGGPAIFEKDAPFTLKSGRHFEAMRGKSPNAWFTFSLSPIRDEEGEIVAFLNIAADTTRRVLVERDREAARAEAEAAEARSRDMYAAAEHANRAKSQFLANMSHEIRTPINAIVGYADLLDTGLGGQLSGTQQTYIDRIRASTRHLLTLVNDVLDVAKVEAGRMRVRRRVSSVDVVVQTAMQMMSQQARAKHITLRCEPPDHHLRFLGDEDRTRQIVLNLVSNALKFTDEGEVVVRYFARDDSEIAGGPWVIIEVSDTGRGIAGGDFERIFEPFAQSSHEPGAVRGTGLGLSISRKLARLMGGDITVKSTVGAGSTFTLRLASGEGAEEGAAEVWLRAELPMEAATIAGLSSFGKTLVEHAEPLETELVVRLSTSAAVPDEAEQSQLADHAAAYFATLGKLLINLDTLNGDPAAQDSEDILKVVTDRHGRQRQRLGWSRTDIEHEYTVLHSLLDSFLRTEAAPGVGEDVDPVLGVVHSLLDYGQQGSLAGFDAGKAANS